MTESKLETQVNRLDNKKDEIKEPPKQFLSSIKPIDISKQGDITPFLEQEIRNNSTLTKEYKKYTKYASYPLQRMYYFLLEKYNIFLNVRYPRYGNFLTPISGSIQVSQKSYLNEGLCDEVNKNIKIYFVNDSGLGFKGVTRSFNNRGKQSNTIIINRYYINSAEEKIYSKIYGEKNLDQGLDGTIADELSHYCYTNPNKDTIDQIDWSDIGAKNGEEVVQFISETANFDMDNRKIAEWLYASFNDLNISKKQDIISTGYGGIYSFTYNKFLGFLSKVFNSKNLNLIDTIINGPKDKGELIKYLLEKLDSGDIQAIKRDFQDLLDIIARKVDIKKSSIG